MKLWLFLTLAISLSAFGQALPPMPPMPLLVGPLRSPKHLELLASLGKPMARTVPATASQAPPVLQLTWDYPSNLIAGVRFEVWHATVLIPNAPPLVNYYDPPAGFGLLTTVDAPPVTIIQLPQEFFVVRAIDRATQLPSYWNQ